MQYKIFQFYFTDCRICQSGNKGSKLLPIPGLIRRSSADMELATLRVGPPGLQANVLYRLG